MALHFMRHAEALHNVEEGENRIYEHNDPPLSDRGRQEASLVGLSFTPDLVLVSPMIRALDTVLLMLDHSRPTIIIDPELRPAHDHAYNQGSSRSILASKYTDFDFSECSPSGRYEPCTEAETCRRAIKVLDRLSHYLQYYSNIVVVTHRGLLRYLDPFPTKVFRNCEIRSYTPSIRYELADLGNIGGGTNDTRSVDLVELYVDNTRDDDLQAKILMGSNSLPTQKPSSY
ncbi:hypothetical protein M430DRAFT_21627 [Amorphotheca resinae ATCC 22711]|uniref:Phosphoglycerate mutase-like protein n=1 Tax=Amorphotheca resinae ATCC 22711 TaxID=857342 RepID=A0A2T3AV51_AMORE|nr:hypothetical protein M430DRAFT_21627 [Amorphotheca resinae ATCC 22711]PSS12550.1 hypothetical protein M430DRAFT_21627 [Amorphotheca resinae ATCC 22711]